MEKISIVFIRKSEHQNIELSELDVNIGVEDSILRKIVEIEDRFNIIESEKNEVSIDLISPVNGLISEGFNFSNKHFGVDIVLKNEPQLNLSLMAFHFFCMDSQLRIYSSYPPQK